MKMRIIYFRYYREVRAGCVAGDNSDKDFRRNLNTVSAKASGKPKESNLLIEFIRWDHRRMKKR